jgi:hypothetical protein
MTSSKYIGMDVHKESISIAVRNAAGKIVTECVIETKASMILQFIGGLGGDVQVTFEETLTNQPVCNATHRVAAKTLVAGDLVGLALTAAGLDGRSVIAVLLAGAIVPVVYSLVFYKQLERRGEL